jgi:hypothetical protein
VSTDLEYSSILNLIHAMCNLYTFEEPRKHSKKSLFEEQDRW